MDLERSFGPIYARGVMRQARTAFAVLGVNAQESQSSIDAALTFAILWLDACRNSEDHRVLVEGVKLFVPAAASALTCERVAHLNADAAKWHLYEFDERHYSPEIEYFESCRSKIRAPSSRTTVLRAPPRNSSITRARLSAVMRQFSGLRGSSSVTCEHGRRGLRCGIIKETAENPSGVAIRARGI